MRITLSNHDILYWLEGCARGSHLRQGCWQTMINAFNDVKDEEEQNFFYMYAKRDLSHLYETEDDGYQPFGADDFRHFLARYNPANRWTVHTEYNGKKDSFDCYKWQGEYHTDQFTSINPDCIVEVEHVHFSKCINVHCPWKDKCVRYSDEYCENSDGHQYTESLGCEWAIGDNETGVIENNKKYEENNVQR